MISPADRMTHEWTKPLDDDAATGADVAIASRYYALQRDSTLAQLCCNHRRPRVKRALAPMCWHMIWRVTVRRQSDTWRAQISRVHAVQVCPLKGTIFFVTARLLRPRDGVMIFATLQSGQPHSNTPKWSILTPSNVLWCTFLMFQHPNTCIG